MRILAALATTGALVFAVRALGGQRPPGWLVVLCYVAIYWLSTRLFPDQHLQEFRDEPDPDYSGWPTSGPIGRFGQRALLVPWFTTNLLSILNPFQAREILLQVVGNWMLERRERQAASTPVTSACDVRYALPFGGEWFVYNGGHTPKTSHSWHVLGQRYALDFVQVDEKLARHTGRGTRIEDYYCFDQPIFASAEGVVELVQARVRNARLLGWGVCDFTARSFIGNYVLIRHAGDQFALYAHLGPGSVEVVVGQEVRRGQILGRCGNTGHSTEPHLHFHVQDSANLFRGMGLPIAFHDLFVNDEPRQSVVLAAGDRARPMLGER